MADKLPGIKVENTFLSTESHASSHSAPFDWPTVKVKVENEVLLEEDEANYTGLSLQLECEEQNREAAILGSLSMKMDNSSIIEVEDTALSIGNCAPNATSLDSPIIKVKVENEPSVGGRIDSEIGMRKIKVEKADASSGDATPSAKSYSLCTNSSPSVDASMLIKEEDLGISFEEEEESTCDDYSYHQSFEGKDDLCHDYKAFVKVEENNEFSGCERSSPESAVSSSENSGFVVSDCDKSQQKDSTFTSEKRFSCVDCSERFRTEQLLNCHTVIHSDAKLFICSHCPSTFTRKGDMRRHLSVHSNERPFACSLCPSKFTRKNDLKRHLLVHSNDACPRCPSECSNESHTKQHLNLKVEPFACPHCPSQFPRKDHLERHLLVHSNVKPFACPQCPSKFTQKCGMKKHLATHSNAPLVKPFACPLCPYRCAEKSHLKRHAATHSKEKPFACPYCPSKFTRNSDMTRHLAIHSSSKPFACPHCPFRTHDKSYVKQHLAIHSNIKAFACSHCLFRTNDKKYLKRHLAIHSNIKPFACSHCPFRTNEKRYLKKHLGIHAKYNII